MRIAVCLKPVPDPAHWDRITLDPDTGRLRRQGIPSVINPLDKHALTEALRLAEESQGDVTVISMAPPEAAGALREALAVGAHRAVLLCDAAFAGADSLATAHALAGGIRRSGSFDLILCGARSLDGSTAQVGPQLAVLLGIPHATCATRIEHLGDRLRVRTRLESGHVVLEMPLPALVTVSKELNVPRGVTLKGLVAARGKEIATLTKDHLEVSADLFGLAGSPTRVSGLFAPRVERRREILEGPPPEALSALLDRLRGEGALPAWCSQIGGTQQP